MKEMGVGIIGTGWVSDEYIRSFEATRTRGSSPSAAGTRTGRRPRRRSTNLKNCAAVTDPRR